MGEQKMLHFWCLNQRKTYKLQNLSEEKIDLLESLPEWIW